MIEQAYAKLNLCLDVVGRRSDGYHELNMLMVPLTLSDTLDVTIAPQTELITDGNMPMGSNNTILRAIDVMRERYGFSEQFRIRVKKQIPMQAGLAGGSSDGAAMMRAINCLLNLHASVEELAELGKQIGADVPFCVYSTPAVVKGIGEIVKPVTLKGPWYVLLIKPEEGISTKDAFAEADRHPTVHPNPYVLLDALNQDDFFVIIEEMKNSLEVAALQMAPIISVIKEQCLEQGLDYVLMSGSGSCVFAMSREAERIETACSWFTGRYPFVCQSEIVSGS